MTLAIDASSPATALQTAGGTATVTSVSFTPPANSRLVILWAGNTSTGGNPTTPTITDSRGTPLTYTLAKWISATNGGTLNGQAAAWTAPVTTSAAMTITVTNGSVNLYRQAVLRIIVVTDGGNLPGVGASGAAQVSATAVPMTYAASGTGGWGFAAYCDWQAPSSNPTAGAGATLIDAQLISGGILGAFFRRASADDTSGATQTMTANAAAAGSQSWATVEILPAAGSAFTTSAALTGSGTLAATGTQGSTTAIATFTDDFSTQDAAKWGGFSAGAVDWLSASKQVQITCSPTYYALFSISTFMLVNSAAYVQLVQTPNLGNGSTEVFFQLVDASGVNNVLGIGVSGSSLITREQVAGANSDAYATYDATAMKWLRIRHDGTNVYWETSPNAATWTVQRTKVPSIPVNKMSVRLTSGYWGTESTPGAAIFDNINTAGAPSATAALGGSGALSATATPKATTTGALTGSGALSATITPRATTTGPLTGSGALSATATATQVGGPYRAAVTTDSPVAWWHLDETTGTTAVDSIGARNGTITGSPALGVPGLAPSDTPNLGLILNNSTLQYVEAATSVVFAPANLTVEVLVQSNGINGNNRLVEMGGDTTWSLYMEDGSLKFNVFGHASANYWWNGGAGDTARHHIVGTYDSTTGTARLYIDGTEVTNATGTPGAPATTGVLRIGQKPGGTFAGDGWNGKIDEVAIYATALTAVRITAHASAAGLPASAPNVAAALSGSGTLSATTSGGLRTVTAAMGSAGTLTAAIPGPATRTWKGYVWDINERGAGGIFTNSFSRSNAYIDASGFMHLLLTPLGNGQAVGAEIAANRTGGWGYGTYTITVGSPVWDLHANVVYGGFFTYGGDAAYGHRELDLDETSKWSNPGQPGQLSNSVWFNSNPNDPYSTRTGYAAASNTASPAVSAHTSVLIWEHGKATFRYYSGRGVNPANLLIEHIVTDGQTVTVTPDGATSTITTSLVIPKAGSDERPNINLWVCPNYSGLSDPATVTAADVILEDFSFVPLQGTALAALADDFSTQDATKWGGWGSAALVDTGTLRLNTSPAYAGITSTGRYTLTGSSVTFEVPQVPNVGNGSTQFYVEANVDSLHGLQFFWGNGQITGKVKVNGTLDSTPSTTYSATAHRWWRIAESGGTVTFATSPDRVTWTTLRTAPITFSVTSVTVSFWSGYWGTETAPGFARVDNINTAQGGGSKSISDNSGLSDGAARDAITGTTTDLLGITDQVTATRFTGSTLTVNDTLGLSDPIAGTAFDEIVADRVALSDAASAIGGSGGGTPVVTPGPGTTVSVNAPERGAFYYSETHYQGTPPGGGGSAGTTQTDSFTGTNGAAPSSTNFTVSATTGSSATIQTNALRLVTGTAGAYADAARVTSTLAASTDVEVTLDVTAGSSTIEAYFDLMLRATGTGGTLAQAGYKFEVANSGAVSIQKVTSFSGTVLGSGTVAGYAAGTVVHIDAAVSGSTLSLYAWTGATKPGTPTVQVTDATYTGSGNVGFYLNGGNAAGAAATWTVDNWSATTGGTSGTGTPATGYVPLSASAVASAVAAGQTQVFRYFYIERYMTTDTIEQAFLDLITADMAIIRNNGAKAIIRFAYSNNDVETYPYGNPDPGVTRSLAHIQQLAPTLNANADVIEAVEAGFIGIWGEWYYTVNYSAGTDPNVLSAQNWVDRKAILTALLSNLDARIFVLVRYAGIKPNYFGGTTVPADPTQAGYWARMGYHDDALGATADDWGTFITFPWSGWSDPLNNSKAFVASDTATYPLPWGGEIGSNNVTYAAFKAEMAQFHANFWNPADFGGSQATQGWTAANQTELRQLLGHRLRLVSSSVVTGLSAGIPTTVSVTIANDGWGRPLRQNPVWVDFVPTGGGQVTSARLTGVDPRTWAPGGQYTISGSVTAPATAGSYTVHLRITDPSNGLTGNAAYCLPLVNTGTYDASTGRNALGVTAVVTSGGSNLTATAAMTGTGSLSAVRAATPVAPKAIGTPATSTVTTITVSVPATAAAGDYLVAVLYDQNSGSATDWPMGSTGFTRLGPAFIPNDSATRAGGLYGQMLTAAPPTSYTFGAPGGTSNNRLVGAIIVLSGVDPNTPVDSSSGWSASSAPGSALSVAAGGTGGDYTLEVYEADYTAGNSYAVVGYDGVLADILDLPSPSGAENTGVSRTMARVYGGVAPSGGVPAHTITTSGSSSHRAAYLVSFRAAGTPAPALTAQSDFTGTGTLTATAFKPGGPTTSAALTGSGSLAATASIVPRGYASVAEMLAQSTFYCAHRGGSLDYPEMSLYAYQQAAQRGYPALELSLARTSDGVWFGLHDASLDRTSLGTGGGSGTTLVASSMTWAQVQAYSILGSSAPNNPTQPNRPYMRWEELISSFYSTHVIFVDPKSVPNTYLPELLAMMNALPGNPRDRFIGKSFGVAGGSPESSGWNLLCHQNGYTTWGYFYEADQANYVAYAPRWDLIGEDYSASTAAWTALKAAAPGKRIIGHIIPNQSAATTALGLGATALMVSGVSAVTPAPITRLASAALTGAGALSASAFRTGMQASKVYRIVNGSWVASNVQRL